MKLGKLASIAIVLAAILFASQAKAMHWIDAFSYIVILERNETQAIGNVHAHFGETLHFRVEMTENEEFVDFFKLFLKTSLITTTKDKTNDPKLIKLTNIKDQTHIGEFDVEIPVDFNKEATIEGTNLCSTFIVRITFDGGQMAGYDVEGTYAKERKVKVCDEASPVPTPSATPIPSPSPTGEPTPIASPIFSPPDTPVFPPDTTKVVSTSNSDEFNSSGQGAIAACSRTILGKGIKTVVMAIPVAGAVPVAFSLISVGSAVFTVDRRRPEHWVKVVDAVTGKAVGGAVINVLTPDGKVRATWTSDAKTGNTGDLLQQGKYEFVVQKPGYVFPSSEEAMFPLQQGEFVYRSGLVDFNRSNMKIHE